MGGRGECHVSEDIIKSACGKEKAMQLGNASRKIGRHADEKKVVIVKLKYSHFIIQDRLVVYP